MGGSSSKPETNTETESKNKQEIVSNVALFPKSIGGYNQSLVPSQDHDNYGAGGGIVLGGDLGHLVGQQKRVVKEKEEHEPAHVADPTTSTMDEFLSHLGDDGPSHNDGDAEEGDEPTTPRNVSRGDEVPGVDEHVQVGMSMWT